MLTSGGRSTFDFHPRYIFPPGQTLPNVSNILQDDPIERNLAKWPQSWLTAHQESLIQKTAEHVMKPTF